jgi:hypothetical protein
MDNDFVLNVAQATGIGGVAIAMVIYLFREIIQKNIFPTLTKKQSFTIIITIVIAATVLGITGIVSGTLKHISVAQTKTQSRAYEKPIRNLFHAWETLNLSLYLEQWSTDARQLSNKFDRNFSDIKKVRTAAFSWYTEVIVKNIHIQPIHTSKSSCKIRVQYSIRFTKPDGSHIHEDNIDEMYDLVLIGDTWKISRNYDYMYYSTKKST